MSSMHYNVFLKEVFGLAATLTIKSEATANALNDHLTSRGLPVEELNPRTWKYYLNLSGQYHATDQKMVVRSSDTGEDILFSVENLAEHRTTAGDYAYGSKKYRDLLSRFPEQQELILGILNPVNINEAIAADDHSILYYDKKLVEEQEVNLIPKLQAWINAVFHRWYVSNFSLYADLHDAAFLTILYAHIPQTVLNIRVENCKTEMAHSYHIREYLDSFGDLGKYFDYMTWKQKLFFYRNLRYLNTHAGRWETFDLLTERVFTDRRFPLSEFAIQHQDANIVEDLVPQVQMLRRSINGYESELGSDIQSVREVLTLEDSLATQNLEVKDDSELAITTSMRLSKFSALETKVLESSMVDRTGSGGVSLEDMIVNHWPYLAKMGRYNTLVNFIHPTTGEDVNLNAYDAFLLYLYAYSKAASNELVDVPTVGCWCVRRVPLPTKMELRKYVTRDAVPDYFLDEALRDNPEITNVISPITFYELVQKIHARYGLHEDLYRYQEDMYTNGEVELMVGRFYHDHYIVPEQETSYTQWLSSRNLDFSLLNEDQFYTLAMEIYTKATGYVADDTQKLSEIHSAHVNMMAQLSTYSVQFVHNSNSNELVELRWKALRGGDIDTYSRNSERGVFPPLTILSAKGRSRGKIDTTLRLLELFNERTYTVHSERYEVSNLIYEDVRAGSKEHLKVTTMGGDLVPLPKTDLSQIPVATEAAGYIAPVSVPLSSLFKQTTASQYQTLTTSDVATLRART